MILNTSSLPLQSGLNRATGYAELLGNLSKAPALAVQVSYLAVVQLLWATLRRGVAALRALWAHPDAFRSDTWTRRTTPMYSLMVSNLMGIPLLSVVANAA